MTDNTPAEAQELLRKAYQAIAERKYITAGDCFERALPMLTGTTRIGACYDFGVLCYGHVCDGVRARSMFNEVAESHSEAGDLRESRANACENSMLFSLSYEEYERWAAAVRVVRPLAKILTGQYPHFIAARQNGRPWFEVMLSIAASCYQDGSPTDRKLWSEGASTYHLILENRKALRVDRSQWGRIVMRHGTLCLRMGSRACSAGAQVGSPGCPEDPSPLIAASRGFVTAFLAENAHDPDVIQVQQWQRMWLDGLRARGAG